MEYFFLLSGLFLGWSLGANDAGNVFGAAVETKMVRFKIAAIIASIFVILGAVIEGKGTSGTLSDLGYVNAMAGSFTVALSAAISLYSMVRIRIPVSSSQAIVGAIIGWNFFTGSFTDVAVIAKIMTTWIVSPLLAGLFAYIIYHIVRYILSRTKIHLLDMDYYTRAGLIVVGAFGAYSLGANNIANVMGVFVNSSPFRDLNVYNLITISGTQQLFFLGAIAISVGIFTYSYKVMKTVGHDLCKLSPLTGLIVVLAESLVLFLFSSRLLQDISYTYNLPSLPLVPISSSQAVIGAIVGVGLAQGAKNIKFNVLSKISVGWVVSPIIAGVVCFVSLFIVQNVFDQTVYKNITYSFDGPVMQRLKAEEVNIDRLSLVNGRTYYSAAIIKQQLNAIKGLKQKDKVLITKVSEIYPIEIDKYILQKRISNKEFTEDQIMALNRYVGQKFEHKWQLEDSLTVASQDWKFKPDIWQNNVYNKKLSARYRILYETFNR